MRPLQGNMLSLEYVNNSKSIEVILFSYDA